MNYPRSYHRALAAIISGNVSRATIAKALRELRRTMGHARARRERRHMQFVAPFPAKVRATHWVKPVTGSHFDYTNQAWTIDGKYVRCGHPEHMGCQCYGKLHEGETAEAGALT